MRRFPKGGLIGKTVDAVLVIKEKQIPLHAAYAGYFIILSVFPALLLLLSVLRYTPLQVETLIELIAGFLPAALTEWAENLIYSTYLSASGAVVGLSAVTTLWSASRGIYGLLRGLNAIYEVSEDRGYFYTRGISLVYTFVFFLVMLLTLVLHVFGNAIIGMLTMVDNAVLIFLTDLIDFRFFLLLIIQSLLFTLMFMVLPNQRNKFIDSLPGGLLSSIGWLVFSDIFSIPQSRLPNRAFDRSSN